jgi:hypothetical protein
MYKYLQFKNKMYRALHFHICRSMSMIAIHQHHPEYMLVRNTVGFVGYKLPNIECVQNRDQLDTRAHSIRQVVPLVKEY